MGAYNRGGSSGSEVNVTANQIAYGDAIDGDLIGNAGFTRTTGAGFWNLRLNGSLMVPTLTPRILMTNGAATQTLTFSTASLQFADTATSQTMLLSENQIQFVDGAISATLNNDELLVVNTTSDLTTEVEPGAVICTETNTASYAKIGAETITGEPFLELSDGASGDTLNIKPYADTGVATATLNAVNKPGATNVTEPREWLPVITVNGLGWIPVFAD